MSRSLLPGPEPSPPPPSASSVTSGSYQLLSKPQAWGEGGQWGEFPQRDQGGRRQPILPARSKHLLQNQSHLHHLEDALWVQAALSHFPHACHNSLAGHGHQQAGQGAGLLLKSSIHHVPITNLQSQAAVHVRGQRTSQIPTCESLVEGISTPAKNLYLPFGSYFSFCSYGKYLKYRSITLSQATV